MATKANRKRILVGVGVAAIAFLGIGVGIAGASEPDDADDEDDDDGPAPPAREPDDRPLEPEPGDPDVVGEIDVAICDCIEAGIAGEEAVTECVAVKIWAQFPWPPLDGDHFSHWDAWGLIRSRVDSYIAAALAGLGGKWCEEARGIGGIVVAPTPPPAGGGVVPEKGIIPGLDLSDYESPTNYPRDGILLRVVSGDIFLGEGNRSITYRALLSAGYQAAKDAGASDADATGFARKIAKNGSNRIQYLDLIQCSPWNDALYGTWGYGNVARPGPHGRAIRMLKYHPNNRQRIKEHKPPMRNIDLGAPSWRADDRRAGPEWQEAAESYEYLWLPKLDYKVLYNQGLIELDPTPWEGADENMSSKIFPPPMVSNLGAMNVPPGTWGCPGLPLMET